MGNGVSGEDGSRPHSRQPKGAQAGLPVHLPTAGSKHHKGPKRNKRQDDEFEVRTHPCLHHYFEPRVSSLRATWRPCADGQHCWPIPVHPGTSSTKGRLYIFGQARVIAQLSSFARSGIVLGDRRYRGQCDSTSQGIACVWGKLCAKDRARLASSNAFLTQFVPIPFRARFSASPPFCLVHLRTYVSCDDAHCSESAWSGLKLRTWTGLDNSRCKNLKGL
jgi:hypothetical protein